MKRSISQAMLPLFAAVGLLAAACEKEPTVNIGERVRTSAALRFYESCDALEQDLKAHLAEEMRVRILQAREYGYGGCLGCDVAVALPVADAGAPTSGEGSSRQEGVDYSGTNNQEAGVDEGDLIKTDGYYLYVLNGNRLEILGVPEFGALTHVSTTAIEGYPSQLLVAGDRAVVFSSVYPWELPETHPLRPFIVEESDESGWYWRGNVLTKLTVLALGEDRSAPTIERELYLEGYTLSSRRIDDAVRVAAYSIFELPGLQGWLELDPLFWQLSEYDPLREALLDLAAEEAIEHNSAIIAQASLEDFLPRLYVKDGRSVVPRAFAEEGCRNFAVPDDATSRGFTSLITLDLSASEVRFESDHVMTNWPILYASTDTLLLAEPAQDWWWYWRNDEYEEATNIHRFSLDGGSTTYTGSGRVAGTLLGQFALSEHEGIVRVAATVGQWNRWWMEDPEPPVTHVVTLAGESSLEILGEVGGIAPDERLWAVRFDEDKAYLVTFENIDPLWTVDLSDPTSPRVIGELHVPGVSTYIHPIEGEHLLTVGIAGDDDGGLRWGETQVSLFDVSDFSSPTLISALNLAPAPQEEGWTYAWSEATYEHKAFQYWGPMRMLAIPLSTYRYDDESGAYEYRSELALIEAAAGEALRLYGTIDHSDLYNAEAELFWAWRDIRRSFFMGEYLYAISDRGVTCHRLSDLQLVAEIALPGSVYGGYPLP